MENAIRSKAVIFREYLRSLYRVAGFRAILAVGVLIAVGLTEGIGLLMLIPFLQLIGIGDSTPSGIVAFVGKAWQAAGLPLNLATVLCAYAMIVSSYALIQWWSTILNSKISHAFTRSLRNDLFEAMTRVQWLRFTQIRGSDINTVMTSNVNSVDNGTYGLFALISTIFVVAIHIGVALTLSVPLTLVAIASSAALLLVLRPLNRQSYSLGEEWTRTMNSLFGVLMEHLGGMKLAKSFGAEERHVRSFSSLSAGLEAQANRFAGILSSTQMYYEIGGAGVLCLFFYIAIEVVQFPATQLLIFLFLFARLVPQFSWMQRTWQGILNMLPAYGAALQMLETFRKSSEPLPSEQAGAVSMEKGVEFRGVSFRYEKNEEHAVIQEMDVEIPAFKTTVVVGPSGGGKSTFADLLMGLLTPDRGEILVDGRPLQGSALHAWRQSVGYVPQDSLLFHETIRENLLWARSDATEEEIWESLRLAASEEFVAGLPQGLDTVVGDRGVRLSGGQRQRLCLARALLRNPTLLLLDEATSSLDQESERRILEALERLRGKTTLVFISHRLAALRCADNVVAIEGGRIAESYLRLPQKRFAAHKGSVTASVA